MRLIDVIVLAAGRGERLEGKPKAFQELRGQTLLERTVTLGRELSDSVLAAVPPEELERARRLVGAAAQVIPGGPSRGATFRQLLEATSAPTVAVLDVVHPFVSADLCRRVLTAAGSDAAAAVARTYEQVIHANGAAADGDGPLYLLQKPIVFRLADIRRGLAMAEGGDVGVIELLRLSGTPVHLVEAGPWNVKLTTAQDLELVRLLGDRPFGAARPS